MAYSTRQMGSALALVHLYQLLLTSLEIRQAEGKIAAFGHGKIWPREPIICSKDECPDDPHPALMIFGFVAIGAIVLTLICISLCFLRYLCCQCARVLLPRSNQPMANCVVESL